MLKEILARLHQRHRTIRYPDAPPPPLPDRLRGRPEIDGSKCPAGCDACIQACPTGAIARSGKLQIDLAKCLFCTDCMDACPQHAIVFTTDHRLACRQRDDLVVTDSQQELQLAAALDDKLRKLFGRSLKLRQVSAGGCNACEADINVLATVGWDIGRFGIQVVASPRHADGLIVTGPVSRNMELALRKTYDALAEPRIVIVVGACACSGGPFIDHPETCNGVANILPVDLYIPGCPPHPLTILDGLLRLLGRLEEGKR